MSDAKRKEIKEKIEAAEARNAERDKTFTERATEAAETAKGFVREHPFSVIAGGVAVGVLISALIPRSPTRKIGKQIGNRASTLAAMAAEMALVYGEKALEAAHEAKQSGIDRLEDLGDAAGDTARSFRRDADYYAGTASDTARKIARNAGKALKRSARDKLN